MFDIKLYIISHKEFDYIPQDRIVIGVGDNRNIQCANLYDNTGDNIAYKNESYCELTALYWLWKNETAPIIGFEHYRRFFLDDGKPIDMDCVKKMSRKYDLIVSQKYYFTVSLRRFYASAHIAGDLSEAEKVIVEKYPAYEKSFSKVMNHNSMIVCNMFIAKKSVVDGYCEWLFDILGELEKRIDMSYRDDYQKRVFGFLAERLFNVFLYHNRKRLKIKHMNITDTFTVKSGSRVICGLKYLIKKIIGRNH